MIVRIMYIVLIFVFAGCANEKYEVLGVVTDVECHDIGRNMCKQVVTYSYLFEEQDFERTVRYWFEWQGNYKVGDSVRVRLEISDPLKSEIVGVVNKPKPVKVIKLK